MPSSIDEQEEEDKDGQEEDKELNLSIDHRCECLVKRLDHSTQLYIHESLIS